MIHNNKTVYIDPETGDQYNIGGGGDISLIIEHGVDKAGKSITVTNESLLTTVTADASGTTKVSLPSLGDWTVSLDGREESVTANYYGQYYISLGGRSVSGWANTLGISASTLEDILEADMRMLMTKHVSCNYLLDWYAEDPTMIDQFIANAYAMKWIGLRDYICDKLMAIADVQTKMLASDNWEYILKDHVPVMTSDTAPYGECGGTELSTSYPAYVAFDCNDSTSCETTFSASPKNYRIYYKFTNPIKVNKIVYKPSSNTNNVIESANEIQASNDGINWTVFKEFKTKVKDSNDIIIDFDNDNYYLYYAVFGGSDYYFYASPTNNGYYKVCSKIQFYGRSLNVSVPTMTSNTAPFGEVISDGYYASWYPYYAFDKSSTFWHSKDANPQHYIGYKFPYGGVRLKSVLMKNRSDGSVITPKTPTIQGSNDGMNWETIATPTITKFNNNDVSIIPIDSESEYQYFRIVASENNMGTYAFGMTEVDFYGVDYSERENRTYIYDHGVELANLIVPSFSSSYGSVEKELDRIIIKSTSTGHSGGNFAQIYSNIIDLSSFDYMCLECDDLLNGGANGRYGCLTVANVAPTSDGNQMIASEWIYNALEIVLNIANVNQSLYPILFINGGSATLSINEWWLE